MSRLIIVSNRLPVTVNKNDQGLSLAHSVGGLATGLSSFYKEAEGWWIGWPGLNNSQVNDDEKGEIYRMLEAERCRPVFLDDSDFVEFYSGFSNDALWPLFHYFTQYCVFDADYWEKYKKVNRIFAEEVAKYAQEGDNVWVQDYHFLLLPQYVKERVKGVSVGFFLHIPFPSSEVFRQLPWREEILRGMLGADLLGFHTYDYVRHFQSSVRRLLGYEHTYNQIRTENSIVRIDAFPIGIDFDKYYNSSNDPEVLKEALKLTNLSDKIKVILSVDRLDYSKGLPERLKAYDLFLEKYPQYISNVHMIMLSVPSRVDIDTYRKLKDDVDMLVGQINGKYGAIGWTPITYMFKSFPFAAVGALYIMSQVCLVTPMRDGMNLVAKEFVAAKGESPGALVLSETAGAAQEMSEAIIVNPTNKEQIADAIKEALEMSDEEQKRRLQFMQDRIKRYNIYHWAADFIQQLEEAKKVQSDFVSHEFTQNHQIEIINNFKNAAKALFLLDYDGTLVKFEHKPEHAVPDKNLKDMIAALQNKAELYIISGRDRHTLDKWFKDSKIGIIAEHGVWTRCKDGEWKNLIPSSGEWKKEVRHIFDLYTDRTPGSFVEEKDYSLVWHYRNVNPNLASARVNELKDVLLEFTHNLNLGLLDGNKVLELKNINVSKGAASIAVINELAPDFIMAIGDDVTDEFMFKDLPETAVTIKVGYTPSYAKFNIKNIEEVREFLNKFVS